MLARASAAGLAEQFLRAGSSGGGRQRAVGAAFRYATRSSTGNWWRNASMVTGEHNKGKGPGADAIVPGGSAEPPERGCAMSGHEDQLPLWTPSAERVAGARMTAFMEWAGERHGREFADYGALWEWSVGELEEFWADIWEYCGVRASRSYERVLGDRESEGSPIGRQEMPGARWFQGARLNYAENMLLRDRDPQAVAVVHESELRPLGELTWGELSQQVAVVAEGLRSLGVERGDRVGAYMPNVPETLVAFLACASIGAIWSCAAPEFGARSVVDRFAQIEPKVLFAVDGYRHGGKDFDRSGALATILEGLPSVEHTVTLPYLFGETNAPCGAQSPHLG